jgi:glycosyltransferase involved in cell wall biosynthesis
LKILTVTHYFAEHGGGIESVAKQITERLAARGHACVWAATAPSHTQSKPAGVVTALEMNGSNHLEEWTGAPFPIWDSKSLQKLREGVIDADLVHIHDFWYSGNRKAFSIATELGRPVVITQHVGTVPYRNPLLRWAMAMADRRLAPSTLGLCDQTVFISERTRRHFDGRFPYSREPILIPNGVDLTIFAPAVQTRREELRKKWGFSTDAPVWLFVGRFVEKKGLRLLRRVCQQFANIQWCFVGQGPLSPEKWHESEKPPRLKVLPWQKPDALVELYQLADLLVLPSIGEGFPLVVQEAMASGTPCLITHETASGVSGDLPELSTCDPQAESLGAALQSLERQPPLDDSRRMQIANHARGLWDWNETVSKYEQLFESLCR